MNSIYMAIFLHCFEIQFNYTRDAATYIYIYTYIYINVLVTLQQSLFLVLL